MVVVGATTLGIASAIISIAAAFSPMVPQPWEAPAVFFRAAEVIIEAGEILIEDNR